MQASVLAQALGAEMVRPRTGPGLTVPTTSISVPGLARRGLGDLGRGTAATSARVLRAALYARLDAGLHATRSRRPKDVRRRRYPAREPP
jgi:hypothetical protein